MREHAGIPLIVSLLGSRLSCQTLRSAIDRAIRPSSSDAKIDSFTAPIDIALYAQRHGMRATLHNDSSTDDLKAMLAQGVPPVILYDWDTPYGKDLHS